MDVIIQKGRVIDPENNTDDVLDVAIKDGKIFKVGKELQLESKSIFDAEGLIVTPGLIDAHVHCYEYATPLGINPDSACLSRGVTTVVDAGSAGASTFLGLRKYIVEKSRTRVRCLLHIALHGLAAAGCSGGALGGESDTSAILDEEACVRCIQDNRDVIVGVKVRLSASVCGNGSLEAEAYRRALSAARRCEVPLMVHHVDSTIPTQVDQGSGHEFGCPRDLGEGDIYTHTFHGWLNSIVDPNSKQIYSDVTEARSRGVLFDCGHGAGAFNWTVAEIAAQQKFWPDLIGSDLHTVNQYGPAYDLPTVMTKFLHLGMPLHDVIKSVTSSPARAYSLNTIGSLTEGKCADITVFRMEDCNVKLEDSVGQVRNVKKRLRSVAVWREGMRYVTSDPTEWPSQTSLQRSRLQLKDQLIKD